MIIPPVTVAYYGFAQLGTYVTGCFCCLQRLLTMFSRSIGYMVITGTGLCFVLLQHTH